LARNRFDGREPIIDRFRNMLAAGSLGQSYLFSGPEGSGKELTALEVARIVNCPGSEPCSGPDFCESCHKALTFQHPDIRWIGPAPATIKEADVIALMESKQEDPLYQPAFASSSEITIGDPEHPGALTVRSVLQFLRLRPFQGRFRIAIVADANRMRVEAANALLKTLEEPPADTLILMLTSVRSAVLPTILSRCQQMPFEPYGESELIRLLIDLYGPGTIAPPRRKGDPQPLDPELAISLARASGGNARRAAALRLPVPNALKQWARTLIVGLAAGKGGAAQTAAEMLHKGKLPEDLAREADLSNRQKTAEGLPERRERAIQLCEMMNLYYSDVLACREIGADWRPRLAGDENLIRDLAARSDARGLLHYIDAVEKARAGIDRNLNIGLTMAVLFQELMTNAPQAGTASGARPTG